MLAHLYASRDDGRNGRDYHVLNEPDFDKSESVNKESKEHVVVQTRGKFSQVPAAPSKFNLNTKLQSLSL